MGGSKDSFTSFNPITNFVFFIGAIALGMVFRHPLFTICSLICGLIYYFTIKKTKGISFFSFMVVLFIVLTFINPFFNSYGTNKMFVILGRTYYFEALVSGASIGAIVVTVLAWFACYNAVMTSDKFIYIFGRIIPSMSLVLSMILRLIPSLKTKYSQISNARKCIGLSANNLSGKQKIKNGMTELSVLTAWSLEGGIVTADSMRCRGYGSGKRSHFMIYNYDAKNIYTTVIMLCLITVTVFCAIKGASKVEFYPELQMSGFDNIYLIIGIISYFLFLLIPTFLNIKESILWRILKSRI